MEGGNLNVIVRVRSRLSKEKELPDGVVIDVNEPEGQIIVGFDKTFSFDSCFDGDASQERLYKEAIASVVSSFVEKQDNCSILAYGQTGSGKTYTMFGKDELDGLVPQAIRDIFQMVDLSEVLVKVSFFEIYQERAYDLLENNNKRMQLNLRDDGTQFQLTNLIAAKVDNFDQAITLMRHGLRTRAAASNGCNQLSSRSHAIFKITLSISNHQTGLESEAVLNLVDLAGSESVHRTQAIGVQLSEGNSINKGLLALGGCIRAISEKKGHIPFRDSTLTRVLKECLQGEGLTSFIACVSPLGCDVSETLSTLRYADSAKNLKKPPLSTAFQSQQAKKRRLELYSLQTPARANSTLPNTTPRSLFRQQKERRLNCSTPASFRSPSVGSFITSTAYRKFPTRKPKLEPLEESDDTFDASSVSDQASVRDFPSSSSVISGKTGSSVKDYFNENQTVIVNSTTLSPLLKHMESLIRATIAEELRRSPRFSRTYSNAETAFNLSSNQTVLTAGVKDSKMPHQRLEETPNSNDCTLVSNFQDLSNRRKSERFKTRKPLSPICQAEDKENQSSTPSSKMSKNDAQQTPPLSVMAKQLGLDLTSPAPTFPPPSERSPCLKKVSGRRSARRSTMVYQDLRKSLQESGFQGGRRRSARLSHVADNFKNPLETDTNWEVKDQGCHNLHILGLINSANLTMLQKLPAIGPKTAFIIFSHRSRHGNFKDLRELETIPGIQKQFFKKLCLAHQLKF